MDDRLGRMPIWASIDPIRKHWLTLLLLVDVIYGGNGLLHDGLSLWCGVLLLAGTALMGFGWSVFGAAFGTIAWSAFIFAGHDGPIVLGGIAGFHVLIIYDCGTGLDEIRERQQRTAGG